MIRLGSPDFGDEEIRASERVLRSGMLIQGEEVRALEAAVSGRAGRAHGVAVANGTSALELALTVLGIGAGDEVLCPNLTWPSPAHAILGRGARVILVDVDPREWNAAPEAFAAARTEGTKAAIVIDQFGVPARHREIAEALPGVMIVEDAACAIGSRAAEGACGSFGLVSCMSFHPRKVVTTGEGGMCLTDDAAIADRLRVLRNHGQRAPGDFVEAAGNWRMQEASAAIGVVQMAKLDHILARRRAIAARYRAALPSLGWQRAPEGASTNHQTMGFVLGEEASAATRDQILQDMREAGVECGKLSYALHRLPELEGAAEDARRRGLTFTISEAIVDRAIALPMHTALSDDDVDTVITKLGAVLSRRLV